MIYPINEYDFDSLEFKPLRRKPGENGSVIYADCVASFDIETTRIVEREQSVMYVWQLALEEDVIVGRTWSEFKDCIQELKRKLCGLRLVCYVHNLSYEIQFLSGIYHFNDYEIFCTDKRKVLKATMYKAIEFRCSYKLTNLGLAAMAKRYNHKYMKQSGEEFDYTKRRFSDTPLDDVELRYVTYDVLAVVESIHAIMDLYGDDLYTIPLTSTGFVRREVKRGMAEYHSQMSNDFPSYRCYQLLKSAFRGGNTHANRFYAGDILNDVTSMDISSSYPSQQCNKKFPVGKFTEHHDNTIRMLEKRMSLGAASIMRVYLYDVVLRDEYAPVPYISIAKCMKLQLPSDINRGLCVDNGRVLQADFIEMCITDIDYRIIVDMYECRIEIQEQYIAWYDMLPLPIRNCNVEFFRQKTELKNVDGQELYYLKNKELLNAIYGMSVQDVIKQQILFSDCGYLLDESKSREDIYAARQRSVFTQYAYGVWTTAHARESLQRGIDMCGDNLVYVDTDCCKFVGDVDFSAYNAERVSECMASGAYATDKHGIIHYMGVYEHDAHYKQFVTLGAKKYAYVDDNDELHITVSGVNKRRGATELAVNGGIEAFKPGFVFRDSGKTESVYNDERKPVIANVDGHLITITRNVVIRETTYTLGMTDDYATLLDASSEMLNKVHQFWRNLQLK